MGATKSFVRIRLQEVVSRVGRHTTNASGANFYVRFPPNAPTEGTGICRIAWGSRVSFTIREQRLVEPRSSLK